MTIPEFINHLRGWEASKALTEEWAESEAFGKAARIIELQQEYMSGVSAIVRETVTRAEETK